MNLGTTIWSGKMKKLDYKKFWIGVHVVAIVACIAVVVMSFSVGPGLNPPLDIHIPNSEEIQHEIDQQHDQDRDFDCDFDHIQIEGPDGEIETYDFA